MSLLTLSSGERAFFIPHNGMAKHVFKPEPEPNWSKRRARPVALPSQSQSGAILFIQRIVALSYGLDPKHMRSESRQRSIAWPRQVAMYLCREVIGKSLPCIGREFGHRDHTTIIHAIRAVKKRMASDRLYRADVEALKGALS